MSKAFDDELEQLGLVIYRMGRLGGGMLSDAVHALERRDARAAERVVAEDADLDRLQAKLEHLAVRMIALRQPVACDLRRVVSALRAANDLERIGDLAASIAKRAASISVLDGPAELLSGTRRLSETASSMLVRVLAAYRAEDLAKARAVWNEDAGFDGECAALFRTLLSYMMENSRAIGFGMHVAFCIKHLERIGDHVTNMAETVIYIVTGEPVPPERPKGPDLV